MTLQKTTIYPDQAIEKALSILGEPILKLIIIGNYTDFVVKADQLAQDPPIIDRKVIWLKNFPEQLKNHFTNFPDDLTNVVGFSCSTINKVSLIIHVGEPQDYAILLSAYADAGLPINNNLS